MKEKNEIYKKKKNYIKNQYSISGMAVITIFGCIGLLLIFMSGILKVESYNMLYDCVSKNGILLISGNFFFLVSAYCWLSFFWNVILNPKKEILLLLKKENNESIFINKKGKIFVVYDCDKIENKYYYVLKTRDYIYEVLDECNEFIDNWSLKAKKSYWLNFYSPIGNFENIFLLPIIYVILLPGILNLVMAKGYEKIYGIILCAGPLYIIVYDLIYKIKSKKSFNKSKDNLDLIKKLYNIISVIFSVIICFILINIFNKISDLIFKIIFLPFLLCGLCTVGLVLSKLFHNSKLENIFLRSYVIIFLIYWFGFLAFFTIGIVKQENNYAMILITIPFWMVGAFMFYEYIIKKK